MIRSPHQTSYANDMPNTDDFEGAPMKQEPTTFGPVETHLRGKGHIAKVKERMEKQSYHQPFPQNTKSIDFNMLAEPVAAYANHERPQSSNLLAQFLTAEHLEKSRASLQIGMIQQRLSGVEQKISPLEAQMTELVTISRTGEEKYQLLLDRQEKSEEIYDRDYTDLDSRLVRHSDRQDDKLKEVEHTITRKILESDQLTALGMKMDKNQKDIEEKVKALNEIDARSRHQVRDEVGFLQEKLDTATEASTVQLDDMSHRLSRLEQKVEVLNEAGEKRESDMNQLRNLSMKQEFQDQNVNTSTQVSTLTKGVQELQKSNRAMEEGSKNIEQRIEMVIPLIFNEIKEVRRGVNELAEELEDEGLHGDGEDGEMENIEELQDGVGEDVDDGARSDEQDVMKEKEALEEEQRELSGGMADDVNDENGEREAEQEVKMETEEDATEDGRAMPEDVEEKFEEIQPEQVVAPLVSTLPDTRHGYKDPYEEVTDEEESGEEEDDEEEELNPEEEEEEDDDDDDEVEVEEESVHSIISENSDMLNESSPEPKSVLDEIDSESFYRVSNN
ncbi:hypothetical protein M7I_0924 [Glarea lozoyensis 74030]|uniref:Uncharacterized protein n=1 Tax=Glarea lozoyensis (strain ATCC 74030 / MF5533) TaxID=1104152 RepID=H0EEP4_GLAL7|nr:hypothetical protein M7I_0924 [Glarea lozoyensis 74030]